MTFNKNKMLFVIGLIFAYTPFTIVAQTITSSDLEDGGFVCPGVPITLNCTTVGSVGLAWRSQEYVGNQIQISDFRSLFYNVRSRSVNTTVATLTRNENGILESTLRIIPTLNHLNSSVVCVHTDSGNSTLPFTVRVIADPEMPSDMTSNQAKDTVGNCVLHLSWRPPANIDSSDLSHYMIHIDGENVMNNTHMVTSNSSLQQFAYPVCTCRNYSVSIQAVNRCERNGSRAELDAVVPPQLSNVTCDLNQTIEPSSKSPEMNRQDKQVKHYRSALIGTNIPLWIFTCILGVSTITFLVLYMIARKKIKQLEKKITKPEGDDNEKRTVKNNQVAEADAEMHTFKMDQ